MVNPGLTGSVELVYQRTRPAILTGDFPPGSALRLHDLASRSGVSMIPVRETLRLLGAEGFVESIPNRGARVAPLSMDDMLDVYRTRIVLEVEALRQAIPHVTPAVLTSARRLNAKIVRQFVRRGHAEYENHRAFHVALYEPSGSKWLPRLIGIVWDHTERYRRVGAARIKAGEARAEHEVILDRLEARDVDGALTALTVHLEGSVERFRELIAEDPTLFTGGAKPGADGSAKTGSAAHAPVLDEATR